ncbi:glycosyl transferase [Longispora fulva]|uniref:Uncharacterized protein n=1 Tax=Longispora fulva TaxID=619741 RepID=A0A8J7GFN4_9ACTN|nr:hypothetical protein [Longispora fulva]MBG6138009.1 hypothetical protein [Longispora fulva]GIG60262.1 glycosyl transferase [Longispora fulva]
MTVDSVDAGTSTGPSDVVRESAAQRLVDRLAGLPTSIVAATVYLLGAGWLMSHLLTHSYRISVNGQRVQARAEWMLLHGARIFTDGASPWVESQLDFPAGVNTFGGGGMLGLSVPLAPLTLLLGPPRAFAVGAALILAATAFAWYWVLSRHIVTSRLAAVLGGAVGGFAPGVVSHAQGDLGLAAGFLVPFIVWRVLTLREGHALRNGVVLGLLCAWQGLIAPEMLTVLAIGFAVFFAAYATQRFSEVRAHAPAVLRGLAVAGVVTLALLAYPLWTQYFGPYRDHPAHTLRFLGSDLVSFVRFSAPSLATHPVGQVHYAQLGTEQNTYWGWPLLTFLAVAAWWLWTPLSRALALASGVLCLLACGATLTVKGESIGIPGPWRLLADLPVLRGVAPTHIALAVTPLFVLLVALAAQRAAEEVADLRRERPGTRLGFLWYGLIAAALLPAAPAPVMVADIHVPAFVSAGVWRSYVPAGRTLAVVPVTGSSDPTDLRWAMSTDLELRIVDAHLAPTIDRARTTTLRGLPVAAADKAAALKSLADGRASVLVMHTDRVMKPGKNEETLWKMTTALVGIEPVWVSGVWVWDLRTVA